MDFAAIRSRQTASGRALLATGALAGLLAHIGVALAREPTAAERGALVNRVESYTKAMTALDTRAIIDHMPPCLLKTLGENNNMSFDDVSRAVAEGLKRALSAAKIESFSLDGKAAEMKPLPKDKLYALVPLTMRLDIEGKKVRTKGVVVGVLDGSVWHLMTVRKQHEAILHKCFPELAGIEFPGDTHEVEK